MKKRRIVSFMMVVATIFALYAFTPSNQRLVSEKVHISFFSSTPAEDIEAHNHAAVSTLNPLTGEVNFTVPMQGFEFEKALMQKHFNQKRFLDTKTYPRARFQGKIKNISGVNFAKNGTYNAVVEGKMTIRGVTQSISEIGAVKVQGDKIQAETSFNLNLEDYGITFVKGKPASNIAKTVKINMLAGYKAD